MKTTLLKISALGALILGPALSFAGQENYTQLKSCVFLNTSQGNVYITAYKMANKDERALAVTIIGNDGTVTKALVDDIPMQSSDMDGSLNGASVTIPLSKWVIPSLEVGSKAIELRYYENETDFNFGRIKIKADGSKEIVLGACQ